MNGIVCPYCQDTSDDAEIWARIGGETETPTIQLLLDEDIKPEGKKTREELEYMTTLHPCGHSFPRDPLKTVEEQYQLLEALLEEHAESTNPFEIQLLRGEIHSIREQLDVATERCRAEMDTTRPQ